MKKFHERKQILKTIHINEYDCNFINVLSGILAYFFPVLEWF